MHRHLDSELLLIEAIAIMQREERYELPVYKGESLLGTVSYIEIKKFMALGTANNFIAHKFYYTLESFLAIQSKSALEG
ncbi:MAG: hypothetical protein V4687_07185 [Bacteroidota bacterium]